MFQIIDQLLCAEVCPFIGKVVFCIIEVIVIHEIISIIGNDRTVQRFLQLRLKLYILCFRRRKFAIGNRIRSNHKRSAVFCYILIQGIEPFCTYCIYLWDTNGIFGKCVTSGRTFKGHVTIFIKSKSTVNSSMIGDVFKTDELP